MSETEPKTWLEETLEFARSFNDAPDPKAVALYAVDAYLRNPNGVPPANAFNAGDTLKSIRRLRNEAHEAGIDWANALARWQEVAYFARIKDDPREDDEDGDDACGPELSAAFEQAAQQERVFHHAIGLLAAESYRRSEPGVAPTEAAPAAEPEAPDAYAPLPGDPVGAKNMIATIASSEHFVRLDGYNAPGYRVSFRASGPATVDRFAGVDTRGQPQYLPVTDHGTQALAICQILLRARVADPMSTMLSRAHDLAKFYGVPETASKVSPSGIAGAFGATHFNSFKVD